MAVIVAWFNIEQHTHIRTLKQTLGKASAFLALLGMRHRGV